MEHNTPSKFASGSHVSPGKDSAALLHEIHRLSERVSELERARISADRRGARLLERIVGLLCEHLEPDSETALQNGHGSRIGGSGISGPVTRAEPLVEALVEHRIDPLGQAAAEEDAFPPSQTDSASFARLAAALAEADRRAHNRQSGTLRSENSELLADIPEAELADTQPAQIIQPVEAAEKASRRWPVKQRLPDAPPELVIPPLEEPDWNAWVAAWVLAEQRAELLGIGDVPPFSSMLFSPGGGALDTWRSLYAGVEVLREAHGVAIADEQIRALIGATLKKYSGELETLRKKSQWDGCLQRLNESLRALMDIATGDTLNEILKVETCLEEWLGHMDKQAAWMSDSPPYLEKAALCVAALHDRLADRPGSRQPQFSIETKADMITYNAMRACETFLARMNVLRDKELVIGKQLEQSPAPKLREHQTPSKGAVPGSARAPSSQKISRIMRNRWVLAAAGGQEQSELIKPAYELE